MWHSVQGTKTTPQWIAWDFQADTRVAGVLLKSREHSGLALCDSPRDWTVQGSNDGGNWVTAFSKTNDVGWAAAESRTYTFAATVVFKRYRIHSTKVAADNCASRSGQYFLALSKVTFFPDLATVTCTCPNGTPTISTGSGGTLCASDGAVDCSACNAGYALSGAAESGSQRCLAWTECGAGTSATTPSATVDRVCTDCTSGKYSTTANAPSCTAWTECGAGTSATTPSATVDRVCTANPCAVDFTTANGVAGGANYASGSTYSFTCDAGYTPSGVATCTTGAWDTPTCDGG